MAAVVGHLARGPATPTTASSPAAPPATARPRRATTCRRPTGSGCPGHQLEHGHAPWLDPYTFRPESAPRVNFEAWPFAIPYWPLAAALGPVRAWNAFVLLTFIGAGLLACWWLRELELPRGAALAGGLAFAIAPYRTLQSAGHLLGPISLMLPLALAAFERARRGSNWWLALSGAALASIPLSGQVHLALGAIPFFCFYVAVPQPATGGCSPGVAGGVVAAVLAGLLVRQESIVGSIGAGGRSLGSVSFYSARRARPRHAPPAARERELRLPRLAAAACWRVAGLVVLARDRRYGLLAALGLGALRADPARARAPTSRSTPRSGTRSRRSATRACRSG